MTAQTLQPAILPSARAGQATAIEQSRAVAEVHGAIVVAQQVPRDITRAVADMYRSCGQKSLAEKAFFRYSRGGSQISGPSVQLARELARCFGNMQHGLIELSRGDANGQSEMQAFAWDVQTNTRTSTTFIVEHVRDTRNGTTVLTDQRDIYENNANMGARRLREMIFGVLPGWFTEDAIAACYETLARDEGEGTLQERIDGAIGGYATMGVLATQLEQKLGAPQSKWTPYDLAQLTVIYRSLKRGEVRVEDEFPSARSASVTVTEITGQPSTAGATAPAQGTTVPAAATAPASPAKPAQARSNEPRTALDALVADLWKLATTKFGFTKDDREQWRKGCEQLIGRKLIGGTTGNLSLDEAMWLGETLQPLAGRDEYVALLAESAAGAAAPDAQ